MGASAVKLLVYYHPGSATASQIESFVKQVADDCAREDLLLMLEPLSYSLDPDRKLTSAEKKEVVVVTAKNLTVPGVDVLKSEFPLDVHDEDGEQWLGACEAISSASRAPWILLSAAVDYDTYLRQVTAACAAGASGIAVGRAVWQEAVSLAGHERELFLHRVARRRLSRLSSLCHALARPWTDIYDSPAPFDWYKNYPA
jgi:tagatose-1,6-bisphosphate aldolase